MDWDPFGDLRQYADKHDPQSRRGRRSTWFYQLVLIVIAMVVIYIIAMVPVIHIFARGGLSVFGIALPGTS